MAVEAGIHSIIAADRTKAKFSRKVNGQLTKEEKYLRVYAWAHCNHSRTKENQLVVGLVANTNAYSLVTVLEYEEIHREDGWLFDGYFEDKNAGTGFSYRPRTL